MHGISTLRRSWAIVRLLLCGCFWPLIGYGQGLPKSQGLVADSIEISWLRQFYDVTQGSRWNNNANWPTQPRDWAKATVADAKGWFGVAVANGDVIGLELVGNNLAGPLPTGLDQLTQVQFLILVDNSLTGTLPDSLGQNLLSLDFTANQFSGSLPAAWGRLAKLEFCSLQGNQLSGGLPPQWQQLQQLQSLSLSGNRFTGSLPIDWYLCKSLNTLDLSYNRLSGSIPAIWSQFTQLQSCQLSGNRLSGTLPASLLQASQLRSLGVGDNRLTEVAMQGTTLPSYLNVAGNYLGYATLEKFYRVSQQPYTTYLLVAGQLPLPAVDTISYLHGGALTLHTFGALGAHSYHYQWQRQVGGQWVDLPGDTLLTRTWSQAMEAQRGFYRLAMHNHWFTNPAQGVLVLYSRIVYADLRPYAPLARNLPVDASRLQTLLHAPEVSESAPPDLNYVRTFVPRTAQTAAARVALAPVDSVSRSTQYLDGLGRPVQSVLWQASPQRRDLVQPQAYDALGREPRQYLPYAADTTGTGRLGYHAGALMAQQHFYRDLPPTGPVALNALTRGVVRTGVGYSETLFEPSPLNRVVAQAAPGESWQLTSGHAQQRLERPNTLADSVLRFMPDYDPQNQDPNYQGYYAAGELWGTQITDEHGYNTISWSDKLGRVVLKQVEAAHKQQAGHGLINNGVPEDVSLGLELRSRWLRTAYAYDDFGHLRGVLQPAGTKLLLPLGNQPSSLPSPALAFLFHYRYDGRGRQIAKQVPGTEGETTVVYDQLDRPVLSQDARQRTLRQWSWTKYDALGRPILSGLVTRLPDGLGSADLQAQATADTATAHQYEQRTANAGLYPHYYTTNQSFPQLGQNGFSAGQVLAVTYYDDYDFNNNGQADASYDSQSDAQFASGQAPVADALRTTGLVTRTKTRVLGVAETDQDNEAWLLATTFYDERARPVQVQTINARKGLDLLTTQLDFPGQVVQSVIVHQGRNHTPVQVKEFFVYDHTGRVLITKQQLPGEAQPVQMSAVQYNELGQVTRKTIGTGRLKQDVDYAYNSRGWLTSLNDPYQPDPADLFNLSLHYEHGFSSGYEQFNGNLTGQTWRGRDGVQRAYGYIYDPLNRILQGDFVARSNTPGAPGTGAWNQESDRYRLSFVSYDDNGNILTLRRRGLLQAATRLQGVQYGPTDELTYAYAGNRLQAVDDAVTGNQLPQAATYHGASTSLAGDFQEAGVHLAQEYSYDVNGNLFRDQNKGITDIAYNHLNLPRQVRFGTGADSVVFRYTANGQKVAKLVYQTGKAVQRSDYLGSFQYEGDSLRFFPHAEGRVLRFVSKDPAGQAWVRYQREFTVKDHLGNLRLAYRAGQVRTLTATLEQDSATRRRETQQFDSLSVSVPIAVATPWAYNSQFAAQLNAGGPTPQPLGPLTQLGVQRGDTVTVTAYGVYPQAQTRNFWFSLVSFLANLVGQHPPASVGGGGDPSQGRHNLPLLQVGVTAGLPALSQLGGGVPKGYLRVLVFNKDSVLVDQQTQQLSNAAYQGFEPLQVQLVLPQDGYVTAYVGNESNVDVFFDDVTIEHRQGLQVQEVQYDPAGLELAGVTVPSPGIRGLNNYRFNGKEFLQDLGLAWNHQDWRFFDPQLLRWHTGDPLLEAGQESWTPYSFGYDNAVRYADADGRWPGLGIDKLGITMGRVLHRVYNSVMGRTASYMGATKPSENAYARDNPMNAAISSNIANKAGAMAIAANVDAPGRYERDEKGNINDRGSNRNALRHSTGSGTADQFLGATAAQAAKDAHEQGEPQAANAAQKMQQLRTTGRVQVPLETADGFVDQLNNATGSRIVAANPKATLEQLALLNLDALSSGQLYGFNKPAASASAQTPTTIRPTSLTEQQCQQAEQAIHEYYSRASISGSLRNSSFMVQH